MRINSHSMSQNRPTTTSKTKRIFGSVPSHQLRALDRKQLTSIILRVVTVSLVQKKRLALYVREIRSCEALLPPGSFAEGFSVILFVMDAWFFLRLAK